MHRLFGKKVEKPPPPTLSEASGSLNSRIEVIDKKIKDLDAELIRFRDQLKKAKGPTEASLKKRALETLKRKKMYEQQRDQLAGQSFNMEQTIFALDTIKDTQTTVLAMKTAAVTLKAENKKINISEIEDMQDDLQDMFEDMNEISESLGRSYNTPEGCDEADLEAELELLQDEFEATDIDTSSQTSALPNLPNAYPDVPTSFSSGHTTNNQEVDEYGATLRV